MKISNYTDISDILFSSGLKAIFISGSTSLIYTAAFALPKLTLTKVITDTTAAFALPKLTLTKVITDTTAAFVSFAIRGYANNCLDNMQYMGGFFGGFLKYKIMGNNPFLGGINNFGYEACNFHKINSNFCALILEPAEAVTKNLINIPIDLNEITLSLVKGLAFSSILITNIEVVYSPLNQYLNFKVEDIKDNIISLNNSNMCLLGETNFTNMNED
jgi:hypothetical protein